MSLWKFSFLIVTIHKVLELIKECKVFKPIQLYDYQAISEDTFINYLVSILTITLKFWMDFYADIAIFAESKILRPILLFRHGQIPHSWPFTDPDLFPASPWRWPISSLPSTKPLTPQYHTLQMPPPLSRANPVTLADQSSDAMVVWWIIYIHGMC